MPSLPPEIDRKDINRSFEVPWNLPWFRRFPVKPSLWFCFLPFSLPFSTNHWRRRCWFFVDRPLNNLRHRELDPEPSLRVGGHHRHHWTQRGLKFKWWVMIYKCQLINKSTRRLWILVGGVCIYEDTVVMYPHRY